MTTDASMGVSVTLVFADEAHREAWLVREGFVPPPCFQSDKQPDGTWVTVTPQGRRADYDRRKHNQTLIYVVGPIHVRGD